jgi:hypothetical protein
MHKTGWARSHKGDEYATFNDPIDRFDIACCIYPLRALDGKVFVVDDQWGAEGASALGVRMEDAVRKMLIGFNIFKDGPKSEVMSLYNEEGHIAECLFWLVQGVVKHVSWVSLVLMATCTEPAKRKDKDRRQQLNNWNATVWGGVVKEALRHHEATPRGLAEWLSKKDEGHPRRAAPILHMQDKSRPILLITVMTRFALIGPTSGLSHIPLLLFARSDAPPPPPLV